MVLLIEPFIQFFQVVILNFCSQATLNIVGDEHSFAFDCCVEFIGHESLDFHREVLNTLTNLDGQDESMGLN